MKKYWMSKIQWLRYKARAESLNRLICNWFIVVRPEIKVRRCKTRIRRTQRAGSRVEGEGNNSPFAQHNVNLETGEI